MLWKGVYSYEYMDNLEKFNETLLPVKEDFYNHLSMEAITDADRMHTKSVCKDFDIKKNREISWFICSKWYIIVSWSIKELSKYVLKYLNLIFLIFLPQQD